MILLILSLSVLFFCPLLLAPLHQNLESLGKLFKALSILEKYGCNLTSPCRPKFWRSVKHNNPVFRTTVDAAQVKKERERREREERERGERREERGERWGRERKREKERERL